MNPRRPAVRPWNGDDLEHAKAGPDEARAQGMVIGRPRRWPGGRERLTGFPEGRDGDLRCGQAPMGAACGLCSGSRGACRLPAMVQIALCKPRSVA
jgi:hypothetical protein